MTNSGAAAEHPFHSYAAARLASLPNAMQVLDPCHMGFAGLLRRGAENLTEHIWARLLAGIKAGRADRPVGHCRRSPIPCAQTDARRQGVLLTTHIDSTRKDPLGRLFAMLTLLS